MDPCAAALSDYARSLGAPADTRALFAEARAGDPLALRVVDEEARRIALHGDAAVLTGALAVGLRAARENVFVNRRTNT